PLNASDMMLAPVARITTLSTDQVSRGSHTRKPYTSVRLIQTKWNGIVSQSGQSPMATQLASAKAPHRSSTRLRRSQAVAGIPHRVDGRVRAELLPQPPDADLDDVRAGVEVVAPHLGEETLAADDLAGMDREVVEQPKLTVGQRSVDVGEPRLPPREVEHERTGSDEVPVVGKRPATELSAHAREQLVERERLRDVIARSEIEAPQLRLQVTACRQDHDRHLRPLRVQLAEHGEPVDRRQQQVEHDEVPRIAERQAQAFATVLRRSDGVALGLEAPGEERQDSRFVLDHEDTHRSPI